MVKYRLSSDKSKNWHRKCERKQKKWEKCEVISIFYCMKKKSSGHFFIAKNVAVIVLEGRDEWAQQKVDLKI